MNLASTSALFTPVQLGAHQLKHRVVMAPLTRSRSIQPDSVPGPLMQEYYGQRVSEGGLIIGEATNISLTSRGWLGAPGLYSKDQVEGWKKIVETVHRGGGLMLAQLWHNGRSSHVSMTGGAQPVSASVNPEYWQNSGHLTVDSSGLDSTFPAPRAHRARDCGHRRGLPTRCAKCHGRRVQRRRAACSERLPHGPVPAGQQQQTY